MTVQKQPTLSIPTIVFTVGVSIASSFVGSYLSVSERISRVEERIESVKEDIVELKEDVRQLERTSNGIPGNTIPPMQYPNEYGLPSFYHDKKQTPKKQNKS